MAIPPINCSAQFLCFMLKNDEFKLKLLQRWAAQVVLEMESLVYEKKMEDCGLVCLEYGD